MPRVRRRLGRVEAALERELSERPEIGPAERSALRVVAHGLDLAEAAGALDQLNDLSKTYLSARLAASLSVRTHAQPVNDPFQQLADEIAAGRLRHPEDAGPGD